MIVHNISELSLKVKVNFRGSGNHPTLRSITSSLILRGTYRHTPFIIAYQNNLAMVLGQIYIIEHICNQPIQIDRLSRCLQVGQHDRRSYHSLLTQLEDPTEEFFRGREGRNADSSRSGLPQNVFDDVKQLHPIVQIRLQRRIGQWFQYLPDELYHCTTMPSSLSSATCSSETELPVSIKKLNLSCTLLRSS